MSDEKLVIGLPAGSLADANRGGNLIDLLKHAGFPTKGYDKGGPSTFPLAPFLVGWDGRPQEFGSQLAVGELDIAIGGDDWVRERLLELKYEDGIDAELKKVLSLARGKVRIVIIAGGETEGQEVDAWLKEMLAAKPLVTMVSEMPYLALEWFQAKAEALGFGESHKGFSVQKFKTPPRVDSGLVIYETWGKTEAKVTNGAVDFGLEITQTGSAIRNYGLNILCEIMSSEAGIWVNPALKENETKYDLARMFLLNLYGSIYAENKVLLSFNARKDDATVVMDYLTKNKLFGEEPTMNEGINFIEFSVEMSTDRVDLPLAKVRYELAKLGATSIETVPLDSSIPGLDVIDF
jgi:ATP phosphoribosyltransferase